jgi:hypothetical protein
MLNTEIPVAAGSETYDAANVRAMMGFYVGCCSQLSSALGDMLVTGVL